MSTADSENFIGSRCIDPSTTQKLFNTIDIPTDICAKDIKINADGSFSVVWDGDIPSFEGHRSHFPSDFLFEKNLAAVEKRIRNNYPRILWERADLDAVQHDIKVKYAEMMADEKSLHHIIQMLFQYGIAFVSNVPSTPDAVASIGNRIGPLKSTIYGITWDVRSLLSAKNVADTSFDLGFHMDLLYYKEPPRLQILHCLRRSQRGGHSRFSDSFKAVGILVRRYLDPDDPTFQPSINRSIEGNSSMAALTNFKHSFHYRNKG